jgi:molybdopterin-binding protein
MDWYSRSSLPPDCSPFIHSNEVNAMQISARNVLKGKVKAIKTGAVMTEVAVAIPGGSEIVAVITKGSADHLQLSVDKEVYAVIKATEVMIMTD